MNELVQSRVRPEDEELAKKRRELAQLEAELMDRELYVATLRAELASFEQRYLKIVGTRYADLDEINAQIAERRARQRPDDTRIVDDAREARRRAEDSRGAAESVEDHVKVLPSQELKSLYREIAKRIHPDLSSDPEDRKIRERLMAEATYSSRMVGWKVFVFRGRSAVARLCELNCFRNRPINSSLV